MNLEDLDTWVIENPALSALLLGVIGNLLSHYLRGIYYLLVQKLKTSTIKIVSAWSVRNIEFIVSHYEKEMAEVEKLSQGNNESFKLLETLYTSSVTIFLIVLFWFVWYLFLQKLYSDVILYASITITAKYIFHWLFQVMYSFKLLRNAKSIKEYKESTQEKIDAYKKLL
jgi:hypothetical protein